MTYSFHTNSVNKGLNFLMPTVRNNNSNNDLINLISVFAGLNANTGINKNSKNDGLLSLLTLLVDKLSNSTKTDDADNDATVPATATKLDPKKAATLLSDNMFILDKAGEDIKDQAFTLEGLQAIINSTSASASLKEAAKLFSNSDKILFNAADDNEDGKLSIAELSAFNQSAPTTVVEAGEDAYDDAVIADSTSKDRTEVVTNADNTKTTTTYVNNVKTEALTTYVDGSKKLEETFENGKIVSSTAYNKDESRTITKYDSNEKAVEEKTINKDNTYTITTIDPNTGNKTEIKYDKYNNVITTPQAPATPPAPATTGKPSAGASDAEWQAYFATEAFINLTDNQKTPIYTEYYAVYPLVIDWAAAGIDWSSWELNLNASWLDSGSSKKSTKYVDRTYQGFSL